MRQSAGPPAIEHIRLSLLVRLAVRLLHGHETFPLVEHPRSGIALECPEIEFDVRLFCGRQKRTAGAPPLVSGKNVKLLDPSRLERDETEDFVVIGAPDRTCLKEMAFYEIQILLW